MNLSPDLIESVRHIGAYGMISLNCTALSKAIAYVATLPPAPWVDPTPPKAPRTVSLPVLPLASA